MSASERVTDNGRDRLRRLLDAGDPHGEVKNARHAKETLRSVYDIADAKVGPRTVEQLADDFQDPWLPEDKPVLRALWRWRTETANWHVLKITNAATETAIICSASEGVVDVVDAHVTACRGRVIYSDVVNVAMLLLVCVRQCWGCFGSVRSRCRGGGPVRVQRVVMPVTGAVSWTVIGDEWAEVEQAERYLGHLAGIKRSPNTVRAYTDGLRLWFELLETRRLVWDSVGVEDVSRFVAWLRCYASDFARRYQQHLADITT